MSRKYRPTERNTNRGDPVIADNDMWLGVSVREGDWLICRGWRNGKVLVMGARGPVSVHVSNLLATTKAERAA